MNGLLDTNSDAKLAAYSADQTTATMGTAPFKVIIVSGALALTSTSSSLSRQVWQSYVLDEDATSSGADGTAEVEDPSLVVFETGKAATELRRVSGLTWDQLAQLLGVSRRSVHFWASGKPLSSDNEQHLMAILGVVTSADRGSASANRAKMLEGRPGERVYDLLYGKKYEAAAEKLGAGKHRVRPTIALSQAELAARQPQSPESLIEASGEVVHKRAGRGRPARVRRNKERGTT